ncbi:MAG: hypothetical protein ACR2L4_06925 [Actinomycetota bacterium]
MSRRKGWIRAASAVGLMAVVAVGMLAGPTSASGGNGDGDKRRFRASLDPVPHSPRADNGSNVHGSSKLWLDGTRLRVKLQARGLDALPHAMHIHGHDHPEVAFCPRREARNDLVADGLIETVEGLEDYGPILVSFTTRGDTSPASALALDRFPVAKENGKLFYRRSISIPRDIASRLGQFHIVVHGEDLNDDGEYGGRITALGAPLEAELPVACGEIRRG